MTEKSSPQPEAVPFTHSLKTDPEVFAAVLSGAKTFEIRLNDRGFQVGDTLRLRETTWTGAEMRNGAVLDYTGREVTKTVSHVLTGYGLADGWCCLSFAAIPALEAFEEPTWLPHPGSPEASAMIDSMLAEHGWPANAKNAARAGYLAARRLMGWARKPLHDFQAPEGGPGHIAAMQQALDALERCYDVTEWPASGSTSQDAAITALRAALAAQPQSTHHADASKSTSAIDTSTAAPAEAAAVMTLKSLGYTWHGAEQWQPPLGKTPRFVLDAQCSAEAHGLLHEFDQLLQSAERAQRYLAFITPVPLMLDDYVLLSSACGRGRQVMADALASKPQPKGTEPLHLGACLTEGKLHATVMRREANGHITVVATAEIAESMLRKHDCHAVMAPAVPSPAPALPKKWTDEEIERGYVGIRWVNLEGVAGRPTTHDLREELERALLVDSRVCDCADCKASQAPAVGEQPVGKMTAQRAKFFLERFKREEKLLGPNEQAGLNYAIAALEREQYAPAEVPPEWQPIETAPLDVLVWVSPTKRMSGPCIAMKHSRDGWVVETPSEWASIYTPTHWMTYTPPAGPELDVPVHPMGDANG